MTVSPEENEEFVDPLQNYEPVEYESRLEEALAEEKVSAISILPCETVSPTTSVRDAIDKLNSLSISSLIIVDESRVVGIFTERDVLERVAQQFSQVADSPVSEVMTADPFVVYRNDPVGAAVAATTLAGYRHVPVIDESGNLLGMISPPRVFEFMNSRMKP